MIPTEAFQLQERGVDFSLSFSAEGQGSDVERVVGDPFNFLDISPFIQSLAGDNQDSRFDLNGDGTVSFLDISPFIQALAGRVEPDAKVANVSGSRDVTLLIQSYNETRDPQAFGLLTLSDLNTRFCGVDGTTLSNPAWRPGSSIPDSIGGDADLDCYTHTFSNGGMDPIIELQPTHANWFPGAHFVPDADGNYGPPQEHNPSGEPLPDIPGPRFVTFFEWQSALVRTGHDWSLSDQVWCLVDPPVPTCLLSFLLSDYNHVAVLSDVEPLEVHEVTDGGDDREVTETEWLEIMSRAASGPLVPNADPLDVHDHYRFTWDRIKGFKSTSDLLFSLNGRLAPAERVSALFLNDFPRQMTLPNWQAFVRQSTPQTDIGLQVRLINIVQAAWDEVPVTLDFPQVSEQITAP